MHMGATPLAGVACTCACCSRKGSTRPLLEEGGMRTCLLGAPVLNSSQPGSELWLGTPVASDLKPEWNWKYLNIN